MIERGEFLEYAQVFGKHWYGTPNSAVEEANSTGKDFVLEIDVQGAAQVKKKLPGAAAILICRRPAKIWKSASGPAVRIRTKKSSAACNAPARSSSSTRVTTTSSSTTTWTGPDATFKPSPSAHDAS